MGWRVNKDLVITSACWTGIALFGLGALGALVTASASGTMMSLSLAGFCAFFLLRRAENAVPASPPRMAVPVPRHVGYPPGTPPTQALHLPPPARPVAVPPPPPPVELPARVTNKWLAANVPHMHQAQIPAFLAQLRSRGWTEAKISQSVLPLVRRR